jgi:hypothetical protein
MVCLLPTLALATDQTVHVLRDSDSDGNINVCPNPAHQGGYVDEASACNDAGVSIDIDGDGNNELVYCDIQKALDDANQAGDIVEIHQGNYDASDTTPDTISRLCVATPQPCYATIQNCATCDTEAERRTFRAAEMNDSTDVDVIFTPGESGGIAGTICIGDNRGGESAFVTVKGITANGFDNSVCLDSAYHGVITAIGDSDNLIIDGVTVEWKTSEAACPTIGGVSESGPAAIVFGNGTGGLPVHNIEIKNSTLDSCAFIAFNGTGRDSSGNSCNSCCEESAQIDFRYIDVHDNILTQHGIGISTQTWQAVWDFALWNNVISGDSVNAGWRHRQCGGNWYIFNNYYDGGKHTLTNQSSCGVLRLFNNTYYNQNAEIISAGSWTINAYNNSFNDGPQNFSEVYDISSAANFTAGYDHIDKATSIAARYNGDGTIDTDLGNHICKDSDSCGDNTAITDCSGGSGGCSNDQMTISGDAPWPLLGSENLIGAGNNDPLGQGSGLCSITLWTGHVIDCTADYEGDARGQLWDIGADQYSIPGIDVDRQSRISGAELHNGTEVGHGN